MKIDLQHPEPYFKKYQRDPGPLGAYILLGAIALGAFIALTA